MDTPTPRTALPSWRVLIGSLIVAYGVLLTLGNIGWYGAYWILDHLFQAIALMVLGSRAALCATSSVTRTIGWVVVGIGVLWALQEATGHRVHPDQWWPLIIVGIGALMLMRAFDMQRPASDGSLGPAQASGIAFWSGIQRRITSPTFGYADFAAVMGGIEVDMRQTTAAGGRAVMEVFIVWGSIEITVPPDWVVQNEAVVIMGGVNDRSSGSPGSQNTLILRGVILMGGVEIKT